MKSFNLMLFFIGLFLVIAGVFLVTFPLSFIEEKSSPNPSTLQMVHGTGWFLIVFIGIGVVMFIRGNRTKSAKN